MSGKPTSPMPSFAKDFGSQLQDPSEADTALALHTLGSFDFSGKRRSALLSGQDLIYIGHVLNEFVRDVAITFVDNDNPEIRKAAVLTCCQLFVHDPIINQTSGHSIQVVSE